MVDLLKEFSTNDKYLNQILTEEEIDRLGELAKIDATAREKIQSIIGLSLYGVLITSKIVIFGPSVVGVVMIIAPLVARFIEAFKNGSITSLDDAFWEEVKKAYSLVKNILGREEVENYGAI